MSSTKQENIPKLLSTPALTVKLSKEAVDRSLYSVKHQLKFQPEKRIPLFSFLENKLAHIPTNSWSERAEIGGLYINGRRVTSDRELTEPCIVEYYEPKYDFKEADQFYPAFSKDWIVYEDDSLAIVFKPRGLPTQPNKEQSSFSLRQYLERHYKRKVHLPSRLDTATAGLIVSSIHEKTHEKIQRLFERRLIQKRYLCEITGSPELERYRIEAPIGRSNTHAVLREVNHARGDRAVTEIEVLAQTDERTLIRARPITGRTHQIRVHLASFLGPITGDNFYGGAHSEELSLLSESVSFFHPITAEELTVRVPESLIPQWVSSRWKAPLQTAA